MFECKNSYFSNVARKSKTNINNCHYNWHSVSFSLGSKPLFSQKRSIIVFDKVLNIATGTEWVVPVFEVFYSVFFLIWAEYGPEKLQIRTLLTQCRLLGFSGFRWCNLCCTNLLWSSNRDMDFSSQRIRIQNETK